jgi:hypothetical protein
MRGIPPTGRRFSVDYVPWLRLEDRKVAKLWAVRDDVARLQQLGLISMQGQTAATDTARGSARSISARGSPAPRRTVELRVVERRR